MKKLIALILSMVMVCCFCVTAFAAESPTASEKITITVVKGDLVQPVGKPDVEYTVDKGGNVIVKQNDKYGKFNDWTVYKVPTDGGKPVVAVAGVDYEIIKGGLKESELTIKAKTTLIVCGNYNGVVTDPLSKSNADNSANAPQTGDMTAVYVMFAMLAVAAFGFGVKKVYSK